MSALSNRLLNGYRCYFRFHGYDNELGYNGETLGFNFTTHFKEE